MRSTIVAMESEMETVYRGSMGLEDPTHISDFVLWQRSGGTISQLHLMGPKIDGEGHPKTYCGCLTRPIVHTDTKNATFSFGIEAYHQFQSKQREVCSECMGYWSKLLRSAFRQRGELIDKWEQTWDTEVEVEDKRLRDNGDNEYVSPNHHSNR